MPVLYSVFLSLSWLLIIAVALPFVRSDYWIFRILEYPRYQKLVLCILILAGAFVASVHQTSFGKLTLCLLGAGALYLFYKIAPYTLLYPKELKRVRTKDKNQQIALYTANVYQDNRDYSKVLQQVQRYQPDIVFLLETDLAWERAMDVLIPDYPHCLKAPLPNTYGLLFYSKLPLLEGNVNYLVEKDVPSIEAVVQLPSGQAVKLWGLHPKPPVPGEDSRSTAKDKELMKVALKSAKEKRPVIVMGDLNDVAWSYVTELFRKTSGLLDPRRGRAFYSTFNANHWFLRFPLDYVFCSAQFGLVRMKRLPHNGSAHFPMFSQFEYRPSLETAQEAPQADASELLEARAKAVADIDPQ